MKICSVRLKAYTQTLTVLKGIWRAKTPMGTQWFEVYFRTIILSSRESNESRSKLAINEISSSLVIAIDSDCSKSPMGTVFLRVDPLPSGRRHPVQR